jgi:transcriptional regulator with XRE-family HTH domain
MRQHTIVVYAFIVKDFEDTLRRILSENIRAARKSRHLTQTQLAIYADVSLSYMTDIERCKTWVSDKTLLRIARALNTSPWLLLRPADPDYPTRARELAAPGEDRRSAAEIREEARQASDALKRSILKQLNSYINAALEELYEHERKT